MSRPANTTDNPLEKSSLKLYFVVGEESGDNLGVDLLDGFQSIGVNVTPIGIGGKRMQQRGLVSLFDISEISVMGLSGVVSKLPNIYRRIKQTADNIVRSNPDVVLLVDSPEFAYAVAKRVRKQDPSIPIIKYICPTVWAWRPGRAPKMRKYLDHILAILPFEPAVLKELGGPEATYIGHPLLRLIDENRKLDKSRPGDRLNFVVCPGSRKSEVMRLLPVIGETLKILLARGNRFEVSLPAVAHLEEYIRTQTEAWEIKPEILIGDNARHEAFKTADVALAASGTVTLELALYKIPMVSIYKLDPLMMQMRRFMYAWTASLPNLDRKSVV